MIRFREVSYPVVIIVVISVLLSSGCAARIPETVNTLNLGSASLKDKYMKIREGRIYSSSRKRELSFDELIDQLAQPKIIYLGETHTSMAHHQIQFQIVKALHVRNPNLKIGMEFFKRVDNGVLADWSAGLLSEEELLRRTGWYEGGGGYNFGYYRLIMEFARDNNLPVVGLNVPRDFTRKIARGGFEALSQEERAEVGDVDVSNEEHRSLIEFYFGGAGAHGPQPADPKEVEARFERMYAAQSTWDEVMAASVRRALFEFDGTMVVIAGSGHVAYKLGINRRVSERLPFASATLLAIADSDGKGATVVRSLADFFWGVSNDLDPPFHPDFGLGVSKMDGKIVVTMVMPDSLAARAGIQRGDRIMSLDAEPVKDITDLRMRMAEKTWGESVALLVERDGETKPVIVAIEQ